ncbi:ANTAR domain-containing protein [Williamsia deligens]|uniref:ANTAR domain-containing protein n=1 Tax=Williamsia deligens TaxID=321325 RepID=A0ABW3G6B6_9NOCA|nr:ANTAR domain-containing protein [Williamsia deligens]MCP2193622.1 ANTAR domain-containing protein [Williamsia deligens]
MLHPDNELVCTIAAETTRLHQQKPDEATVAATLQALVRGVVDTIDTAHHAGIVVIDARSVSTVAATDDVARDLLRLERVATGGGPTLATAASYRAGSGEPVDLHHRNPWPTFSTYAVQQTPVRCVLPIHLFRTHQARAALAVYSPVHAAFDTAAVTTAATFATVIALAAHAAQRERQFAEALASRDILGQAKGVLMERYSLDSHAAFGMLKRVSMDTNVKVVALAERLITADHPPTDLL